MENELMLNSNDLRRTLECNYGWTGVYILRCLSTNNSEYIQIDRMLKVDKDGIIYIGTSDYLPNRICDLKISILEAYNNPSNPNESRLLRHTCGKKFLNKSIRELIKFEKLIIQIIPSDKSTHLDSHYILEDKKLLDYENEFGEPPPFNEGRRL